MSLNIVFMGPVGAGKTAAIRSISDIHMLDTEEEATDHTRELKATTTVSMDVGTLQLGGSDKLRLVGAPGQARFDFMWDILLEQARGVVLVLNHSHPDPAADLRTYLQAIAERKDLRHLPLVVGVTHIDRRPGLSLDVYHPPLAQLLPGHALIPVLPMDARDPWQVRVALMTMTALLEAQERTYRSDRPTTLH